jgi:hypothetical protein
LDSLGHNKGDFVRAQTEQMCSHLPGPFLLRVQGHSGQQQVAQQDSQGLGGAKPVAAVNCRHTRFEQSVEPQAPQKVVDQWEGLYRARLQGERLIVVKKSVPVDATHWQRTGTLDEAHD